MISYGSDNMYVPAYEGDGWSWGGQSWAPTTYEQVQFDCGTWGEYQQQQQQQQQAQTSWGDAAAVTPAPVLKVGAELLTELRLAELKRLIDRDAKALRASSETLEIESSARSSADCTTRAPDSNEESFQDSPTKEDTASAHSARQAATSEPSAAPELASGFVDDAPPPPGLDAPEEQCYAAVADFTPETRNYGEMPVRIGEEVFVSGEALDGWIFGVKRDSSGEQDEGWLPASALNIEETELEFDTRAMHASSHSSGASRQDHPQQHQRQQQQQQQQQGSSSAPGGSRNGRRGGAAQQQQQLQQQQQQHRGSASGQGRKGGGRLEPHGKGVGKSDDHGEPWHQHGNWWSKGRHLSAASKDPHSQAASGGHAGGRKGPSRPAPPPPPAPWSDEESNSRQAASGRGARRGKASGGGSGAGAASREDNRPKERQPRERPALTSMLDRLNKPLVAPKNSDE